MKAITRRLIGLGALAGGSYWLFRYFRPQHSTLVLENKVVIVTGASSGIGRALAFAFARRGARVVLVARTEERLEAVRREIEPYSADALVIPADITDDKQTQQVVQRTLDTFGRVDVLVNNAGKGIGGWLTDQDPARIEQLIRLNLLAAIRLTQLVLPHMLRQHSGYIMNVGSGFGRTAAPLFTTYVASKYGLSGFTDALRRELDGTGVHLTLVLPGWTITDMVPAEVADKLERRGIAVASPDDVAERAIRGLINGEKEVILGGLVSKAGILAERYAPIFIRLYWRYAMTPDWAEAVSKEGQRG